jgi:hypothetical protein
VHGTDHVELGETGVRDLFGDQRFGDHTDHLAALFERRVGYYPHQADPPAAVDQPEPAARYLLSHPPRGLRVSRA